MTKEEYCGFRPGDRIRMIQCEDPYAPILPNEKGTVHHIDDMGTLHVKWDSGRGLGVCLDEDEIQKVPLQQEFTNFDSASTMNCADEQTFEAHAEKANETINKMEEAALDSNAAWVVRSSYIDSGHEARPPQYMFVEAGELDEMLQGADVKNGIDVGFIKAGQAASFAVITYGQGYTTPKTNGFVQEAFECKLLKAGVAQDYRERIDAGWSDRGEGPQKLFLSPKDHQSLSQTINDCRKLYHSANKSHDIER